MNVRHLALLLAFALTAPVGLVAADSGSGSDGAGSDGSSGSDSGPDDGDNSSDASNSTGSSRSSGPSDSDGASGADEDASDASGSGPGRGRGRGGDVRGDANGTEDGAADKGREDEDGDEDEDGGEGEDSRGPSARGNASGHGPVVMTHRLTTSNGTVQGGLVRFHPDLALPGIRDHAVGGTGVFDHIAIAADDELRSRTDGARFELRTGMGRIEVYGTSNALLQVRTEDDGNATLRLAANVTAAPLDKPGQGASRSGRDGGLMVWTLTLPDGTEALLSGDRLAFDGNGTFTLRDDGRAHFRLARPATGSGPGGSGPSGSDGGEDGDDDGDDRRRGPPDFALERRVATRELRGQHGEQIELAVAEGRVAVEVFVDNGTQPLAVELGDVRVQNLRAGDGPVRVRLDVEAPHGAPGTALVLNLNASEVAGLTLAEVAERLAVRVDGQNLTAADDLGDVLDATDDDGAFEYLLLVGSERVQVLVTVPHFSVHSVEVVEVQGLGATIIETATSPAALLLGALAAAAVVSVTAWRRRG